MTCCKWSRWPNLVDMDQDSNNQQFGGSLEDSGEGNESNYDGDFAVDAPSEIVLVSMLFGVICAVGIAGNLLVCIVLLRVPSLRSNTSDFLVHLALVDLVVCVLVIPFKILLSESQPSPPNPGFFGQFRCRLYVGQYPFWVCALTSVFSLVTVHFERFVAIVYPHRYKQIFAKRRNRFIILALCWITAALTKLCILFLHNEDKVHGCRRLGWPSRALQAAYGAYNFVMNLLAPFVLMVAMQWKVISVLKKQVKALIGQTAVLDPADRRKMWQLRATQTLARTLLAFALTFAVCWAPNQLMFLLYNFGVSFGSIVTSFGAILAVGNSCVNPIIYTMTNQQFRRGIRVAFQRGRNSARVGDGTTATSAVRRDPDGEVRSYRST